MSGPLFNRQSNETLASTDSEAIGRSPKGGASGEEVKVIFVRPKKVVGGALFFFGAMAGSDEVAVVPTKGKEQRLC